MKNIKNVSFYIVLSIIVTMITNYLESPFLFKYLQNSIISLQITLLAINTATLGLIASKIQDITIQFPKFDFSESIKEMKISLLEQIILIVVSICTLIIQGSTKIIFEQKTDISNSILLTVFVYSINIIWDTGKAVFIVIEELNNMNRQE